MLRTPLIRSRVFWSSALSLGMALSANSALACTAADIALGHHDAAEAEAGVVQMTPAARLDARAMAPAEGLKLRMHQQDTVLSAYLPPPSMAAQARPTSLPSSERRAALTERSPATLPAKPAPESAAEHAYKPLAMLAAALVLMVSIALRRSGKR